jgi:hypothetical protein
VDRPKNACTVLFPNEDICLDQIEGIAFPTWLRKPVINAANRLHAQLATEKDPRKAQDVLSGLTSNERMQGVWNELYKTRGKQLVHPAYIRYFARIAEYRRLARELRKKGGPTNEQEAKMWEGEAAAIEGEYDPLGDQPWSDQDLAVQLFLWHVYHAALDLKVVSLSEIKAKANQYHEVAKRLRRIAATLRSPTMKLDAQKLLEVAAACDDEAMRIVPSKDDDPWVMARNRGDVKLRTLVAHLLIIWEMLFDKRTPTMIPGPVRQMFADIANVVLKRDDATASQIREMLR